MSNSLVAVHPELIVEWSDRNLPLTPDSVTFGSNKKVWWKGTCGHEWQTSIKARSNGEKCPICSGARVVTGINDLITLKPELASEWSEKNEIKPTEVSIGSHKKVLWKCKLGHEWTATVKSRTINKTGCPYCSHNKVLAGFNDLATVLPEVAVEWSDRNEKKPTEVTAFANSKAWWKCNHYLFMAEQIKKVPHLFGDLDKTMPFLRFREKGQHYGYELFLSPPKNWGSRGAPLWWAYAARKFSYDKLPMDEQFFYEKYKSIVQEFGMRIYSNHLVYIERFAAGGMSSGVVGEEFVRQGWYELRRRNRLYRSDEVASDTLYLDKVKERIYEKAESTRKNRQ